MRYLPMNLFCSTRTNHPPAERRGVILVFSALLIVVICAMAAMAIDVGYMLLVKTGRGGGNPTRVLLGGDLIFVANGLLWLVTVIWCLSLAHA